MYIVENSKTSAPRVICGRSLAHRHLRAARRAAIAAHEVTIALTARQVAQLIGVSAPYIRAARQLLPARRQAIASGTDLIPFEPLALPKLVSDAKLTTLIRNAGVERVLAIACEVDKVAVA